ncbi:MAG: glycyl-radical enzyme activating protein [bacterium]
MTKGLVFDIKRFAVHDGPGIRTTIFFKGCSLSCIWCHNPESRSPEPQISVKHIVLDGKKIDKQEVAGQEMTVEELLVEVARDRIFFEESSGGVTLSGGEPLYQPEFCEALLNSLKEHGFHTALDTSGYASQEKIRRILPYTDLFLYDLKLMDDAEHMKYTGVSNKVILENLKILMEEGKQVIIRFPVIPGITDIQDNIEKMITFLWRLQSGQADKRTGLQLTSAPLHHCTTAPFEVHLLPYHDIAKNKYKRFQMEEKMPADTRMSHERLSHMKRSFEQSGFRVTIGG